MPINETYRTWIQRICELRPKQRITQIRNFVWLLVGLYHSHSVNLSRIAGKVMGAAKNVSKVRRLSRFLAYRCRAVPVAWTWVNYVRGHSSGKQQIRRLPKDAPVFVVGDSEFGLISVLRQLAAWHWFYVLRQKGHTGLWLNEQTDWQRMDDLVQRAGQSNWCSKVYLTQPEIHWQMGEKEPWCLATNLPDATLTLRHYRRRMWIEERFGDFKKHGFDLETTMLQHAARLSRLTLAVAFLSVWLLSVGSRTLRSGLRHLVDRKDRRDLSLFQIGWRSIDRKLLHSRPISILFLARS